MKLKQEQNAGFQFIVIETFTVLFSIGVLFSNKSINNILHIWILSKLLINAVSPHSASKCQRSSHESIHNVFTEEIDESLQLNDCLQSCTSSVILILLPCSFNKVWELYFGHASSTILYKLQYIKSNFTSTYCITCIRAKHILKAIPSIRKKDYT